MSKPGVGPVVSAVGVLLLLAACGDPDVAQPTRDPFVAFASGSRLRAIVFDGGDGAVAPYGFHDDALDLDCWIRPTDQGYRCVPLAAPTYTFADAACTKPVWVGPPPDQPYVVTDVSTCAAENVYRVFKLGSAHDGSLFTSYSAGSCDPIDSSPSSVELVPADADLLPMSTSTEELGAVDALVATGDDGSRALVSLLDHASGERCVEAGGPDTANGVDRCVPAGAVRDAWPYFATSDCSGGEFGVFDCSSGACPSPPVAVHLFGDACAPSVTFFELGDATQAYGLQDGACVEATFGSCIYFPLGAQIDATRFPALAHGAIGTGRLRLDTLTANGSSDALGFGGFTDTESKTPCHPIQLSSGAFVCVPTSVDVNPGGAWFNDPACTSRVAPDFSVDTCPTEAVVALLKDQPDFVIVGGAPVAAIYVAQNHRTEHVYQLEASGGCVDAGHQSVYELGEEIDPATLAPIDVRTE